MEPDAPDVGRAEPADGPVVFYGRLEGFDGAILVGGGVAGAWGGGEEFDFGEIFFMASYCLVVVKVRRALALVSWWRVRPLFVAALAIRSRWPSSACRANSPTGLFAAAGAA